MLWSKLISTTTYSVLQFCQNNTILSLRKATQCNGGKPAHQGQGLALNLIINKQPFI